jgi:tetratricopeptide (TPR) repeat protein
MIRAKLSIAFTVLMVMCLTNISMAQTSQLQQGMETYLAGDYMKALECFNEAISQDQAMPDDLLCQAYYYRGLTYVRLHNEAFTTDDKARQKLYKDAILSAYQDLKASLNYDKGKLWKQIDLEIKNLHQPLLQEGLVSLNAYNESVFEGKKEPDQLERAEKYLDAAHEIRESYLVCDLLGQVNLDKGKKPEAAEYFSKSEKLYSENLPEEPDFLMAYVLYRLAAIHKPDSIRQALDDDQRGLNLMESEYTRFVMMREKLKPERVKEMEDQYKLAVKDLSALKLDLYMSDNDMYVEALHVFEEELAAKPGDANLLVGYASLLEKSDKEKAIANYEKALAIDSANSIALFNIGALYYAKGKEMIETAQKASEDKQYKLLVDGADHYFREARPYFERALAIDPASGETLQALKTIAFVLDDQPAYQKYQQMEKNIK